MTKEKVLEKINWYLKNYIDEMIIKDIELIKDRNFEFKFSYPYLLLACSGIDFFGGLEKGFKRDNSGERFRWFIECQMGRINTLYQEESLFKLIYDSWRCGPMHQATLKKGFETSSFKFFRSQHLHYMIDKSDNKKNKIIIHSIQFADDFIEAQKKYRKDIQERSGDENYVKQLYSNLSSMINESSDEYDQNLKDFIEILKNKNFIFCSSNLNNSTNLNQSSTSPSVSVEHERVTPSESAPSESMPLI